jgi:hypothetical protein
MSMNSQRFSNAGQAADAILALINAQPRSPTRDELVGIIAGTLTTTAQSPSTRWQETPEGRELLALAAKLDRAIEVADSVEDQAECDAAHYRLTACVQRIWANRPTTTRDAVMQFLIRGAIARALLGPDGRFS